MQEVLQECLEAEMTQALGAASGERTAARLGYRTGYYRRGLVTRIGKLDLWVRALGDPAPAAEAEESSMSQHAIKRSAHHLQNRSMCGRSPRRAYRAPKDGLILVEQ